MGQTCSQEVSNTYKYYIETYENDIQHVTLDDGTCVPVVLDIYNQAYFFTVYEVRYSVVLMRDSSVRLLRHLHKDGNAINDPLPFGFFPTWIYWKDFSKVVINYSTGLNRKTFVLEKFDNGVLLNGDGLKFEIVNNESPERTVKYWQDLIKRGVLQDSGDFEKLIFFLAE